MVDKVAIYIRWSTEDQGEGTTLDVQMDACKSYILSQGWSFRDDLVFVDDGVSGASMDRPALGRLRKLVQQRQVECVVVYKLDRLSRSVLDMVKLVLEEWDGLCSIKSAREPIDTLTPTGKMFFYQLMSFAEWERSVIRDRMFAGKLRRAQEGRTPGFVLPYGFRKGPEGRIEQDPEQAPVVQRIFRLYLSGLGCRAISRALDQEGHPSPAGVKWTESSLARLLGNPAYKGTFVYGKHTVKGGRKVAAKEPLVVHEGFFPGIVSAEEFEAVQRLRAERPGVGRRAGTGRSLGSRSLLSGLLRCACGRACTGIGFSARGTSYRYYACGGAQQTGSHVCDAGNIRQELLDTLVAEKLLTLYRGAAARERLVLHLASDIRAAHEQAVAALSAAERELRRQEESERRVKGFFLDGKLSLDEYRELQAEVNGRLAEARAAHAGALRAEEGARASLDRHAHNTLLLDRIDEWETLTQPEKKQLLRQFIQRIVAFRDKRSGEIQFEMLWRWGEPESRAEKVEILRQERSTERMRQAARRRARTGGRFTAER